MAPRTPSRLSVLRPAAAALLILLPASVLVDAAEKPGREKPEKGEVREMKKEQRGAGAGRVAASEASSPQAVKLRGFLEITDDAEWTVVWGRIAKVDEVRRELVGLVAAGGKGSSVAEDRRKPRGGGREGAGGEQAALRSAVRDKLPDAEVKARLDRLRESYEKTEARLAQAQEELRAVLTVRQEAVAVMAGLLRP